MTKTEKELKKEFRTKSKILSEWYLENHRKSTANY